MGMRFRKNINLGNGIKVNFSKSGVGYSFGTKGARITKTANGKTRTTISIPNTGLSYVSETNKKKRKNNTKINNINNIEPIKLTEEEILKQKEIVNRNKKILAWMCKILFIPMIVLGLIISLVEPIFGLGSVIIGIIEFIYSKNYFKNNK